MRPLEPGTGGILAVAVYADGTRRRIAECARCERVRTIEGRGLCAACRDQCRNDGTIADYGYTRADRLADYIELPRHLTNPQAAERLGVSVRTVMRYKRELAGRPS